MALGIGMHQHHLRQRAAGAVLLGVLRSSSARRGSMLLDDEPDHR